MRNKSLLLVLFLVVCDQVGKAVSIRWFPANVLYNHQWAIGLGQSPQWLVILLALPLLVGSFYLLWHTTDKLMAAGVVLFLGGLISTLIDRIFRGAVVDYLHLPIGPYFNLADVTGFVGLIILSFSFSRWLWHKADEEAKND